jgi:uncharacterized protein
VPLKIDRVLKWFFPREERFFDLFDKSADALQRGARELARLEGVARWNEVPDLAERVHAIEHEGDELAHAIFTELHSTFITPIERSDISALATALDDVLDLIDDAAKRLVLYKVAPIPKGFAEISHLIAEAAAEIVKGVAMIRDLAKGDELRGVTKAIHAIESRGDAAYYQTLERLYADEKEPLRMMQLKEILEDLESALDRCEDVANVLEQIVLLNG